MLCTVGSVYAANDSVDWLINEFKVESVIFIIVIISTSNKMSLIVKYSCIIGYRLSYHGLDYV